MKLILIQKRKNKSLYGSSVKRQEFREKCDENFSASSNVGSWSFGKRFLLYASVYCLENGQGSTNATDLPVKNASEIIATHCHFFQQAMGGLVIYCSVCVHGWELCNNTIQSKSFVNSE